MSEEQVDQSEMMAKVVELAQHLVWSNPDLQVLRTAIEEPYPLITATLQDIIKASHKRGKLILPDLEAFGNQTVSIFSDYSGESSGKYYTYSFLACGWDLIGPFAQAMQRVRTATGLGEKEIAFKDFRMGQMQRALPQFLDFADKFVPGFLLTVVIDKQLTSLFGAPSRASQQVLATTLKSQGVGVWKPEVAEKLLRIVHVGAFLFGLLGSSGQKIFWMTDNDAICANQEQHQQALELFNRVLPLYTDPDWSFPLLGGGAPFKEKHLMTLDLLSLCDVVAGSVEQYLTHRAEGGGEDVEVKLGADKVLQWLAHDGISLKKMTIILRPGEGGAITGANLEFGVTAMPDDVAYIPVVI